MPKRLSFFALTSLAALAAGCATRPSAPQDQGPLEPFVLQEDLIGKAVGRGRVQAPSNNRSFVVYLDGQWDETSQTFTLVEDFEWDDGEAYRRTWRLTRQDNGEWSGGREDTVGQARGFQDGDVFRLEYDLRTSSGMVVRLRDVFVKRADGVVLNRANIGKYGLRVGRVELEVEAAEASEITQDAA